MKRHYDLPKIYFGPLSADRDQFDHSKENHGDKNRECDRVALRFLSGWNLRQSRRKLREPLLAQADSRCDSTTVHEIWHVSPVVERENVPWIGRVIIMRWTRMQLALPAGDAQSLRGEPDKQPELELTDSRIKRNGIESEWRATTQLEASPCHL